ncbi:MULTISPECIES: TadE/TadG family type IV pilus assembly protein [Limibacillus]|jgi:Flp pilus assembly protein TadG|uniref:Flp pilus assembly protein TadG n=1 Tax=Limibacillus halophilus TaxID=1579333 RepID=A0A839SRS3_9PROT|nr:TadE/TadG family type IV pilus assembly protein [Limibacillus halophilus]MBB3065577.1 Flp pilus assembly protein TadG [Limibacillus halophilus]
MMIRKLKRFRATCQGGVMIEAAIAVPLFIILVSSIIQLGFIANSYVQMQDAVRFAAREMSVGRVTSGGGVYTNTCASASGQAATTAQRVVCDQVSALPGNFSVVADQNASGASLVRLTIPLNDLLFFNISFLGGGGTLTAEASYGNEES